MVPGALSPEEVFTPVDPAQGVFFAIEGRKRQLEEPWNRGVVGILIVNSLVVRRGEASTWDGRWRMWEGDGTDW